MSAPDTLSDKLKPGKIVSLKQLQELYEQHYMEEYTKEDVGRLTNVTQENVLATAGIIRFMRDHDACYIRKFNENQKKEVARLLWAVMDDIMGLIGIGDFELLGIMASVAPKLLNQDFDGVRDVLNSKYQEKIRKGKISVEDIEKKLKTNPPKSFMDTLDLLLTSVYVDCSRMETLIDQIPDDLKPEFQRLIALFDECEDMSEKLGAEIQSIRGYKDTIPVEAAIDQSPKRAIKMLKPVVKKFVKEDPVVDIDEIINQVTGEIEKFAKSQDFAEKLDRAKDEAKRRIDELKGPKKP